MKLLYIGSASKPELSSIRGVYLDNDTNKYYIAYVLPPKRYNYVRDESNDFMLIKRPERILYVPNTKYNEQLHDFINDLSPVRHIDLNKRTVISKEGLEYDLIPGH